MYYFDRARNLLFSLYEHFRMVPLRLNLLQSHFYDAFGADFPQLDAVVRNISMSFANANEFLALARPISHKVKYIGGVVVKKPKALSEVPWCPKATKVCCFQQMLHVFDTASKGVVLFSFGTMADTDQMPERLKHAFLDAFASFSDYQFIWKYTPNEADEKRLRKYPNVHTFEWIDQVSVLGE